MNKLFKIILTAVLLTASTVHGQIIQGEVSPGTYKAVRVDQYGYQIAYESLLALGFGDSFPNVRRVAGLGHNPAVDTATVPEDVWSGGGAYPWMTAATSLEIVSTSVNDAAAGTGARTVSVACLNSSYVELTAQVITLNGTTAVPIPVQCFRINSAILITAGSGKVNAGDVNIRDAGGGTVRAVIPAGYGITRQSIYTVPAGHTLQIISTYISALRSSGPTANFDVATYLQTSAGVYRLPVTLTAGTAGVYRHDGIPGIVVTEKTDFALRIISVSVNNTEITGAWLGILRKNPQ